MSHEANAPNRYLRVVRALARAVDAPLAGRRGAAAALVLPLAALVAGCGAGGVPGPLPPPEAPAE